MFIIYSCNDDFLEEEETEEMPEVSEDDFPEKIEEYSEPKYSIIEFDSLTKINRERLVDNAIIRQSANGQISMKIHSSKVEVHSSYENHGSWNLIGIEIDESFEFKTIDAGNVWQEVFKDGEHFATIYYVKNKRGEYCQPYLWYDDNFLRGFTHKSNIAKNTIPERELERIIKSGDNSKTAFDHFLWTFNFQFAGEDLGIHENIQKFYIHPSHIDGRSAQDRIFLIFQNEELVALKHDRPIYLSGKKSMKCEFGLALLIVADWDNQKKDEFALSFSDCK
jgi:hypothetical protein